MCVEELKDAMLEVMEEQLVNEMMQDADNNGNGLIDYDDFVNRVMQGKWKLLSIYSRHWTHLLSLALLMWNL